MRILCVSGSPSPTSWSRELLSVVADALVRRGCEVDMLDLREWTVPVVDTVAYDLGGEYPHPAGRELRSRVVAADGIVLATSVQHASYSGLLKSALDLLEAKAFEHRPVALVANAGAPRGATIACEHLRSVVKAMAGWATPTQVASAPSDFDPQTRQLKTGALKRRCDKIGDELVMFVRALAVSAPTPVPAPSPENATAPVVPGTL